MNKNLIIGLVALVVVGVAFVITKTNLKPTGTVSTTTSTSSIATSSPSVTIASTTFQCNPSGLSNVPSLPSGLKWSVITQTDLKHFEQPENSKNISGISISSSTGKLSATGAFTLDPNSSANAPLTVLTGQAWFSLGDSIAAFNDGSYYQAFRQQGWSKEIDISGYKIMAQLAGGYHGEVDGWVKAENGYFRVVELDALFLDPGYPRYLIAFASDIIPIARIIPSYQPNCD